MFNLLRFISFLTYPVFKKNKILIIESHFPSGSNTMALTEELENRDIAFDKRYYPVFPNSMNSLEKKGRLFFFHLSNSGYRIILNTNGYKKFRRKQILIDYWHGIPIKSMLYMESNSKNNFVKQTHNMDYLVTGSKLESTLLASCMFVPFSRHKVLGSPRMDKLEKGSVDIRDYLSDSQLSIDKSTRIFLYMPTFRKSRSRDIDGVDNESIFNFSFFDSQKFENYLLSINAIMILKRHPLEMRSFNEGASILTLDEKKC